MSYKKKDIGQWGEEQASFFLRRNGYTILARNYYAGFGELDIIAITPDYSLSFIEVKTRNSRDGGAERATDKRKQIKLQKTAKAFCLEHDIDPMDFHIMFEHISIYIHKEKGNILIRKYELEPVINGT